MIPIYEPYFKGNESKYLNKCIDSTWISSQGEYILKFEKTLADYHSIEHTVVTSNCTTALHLSLKSLNIGPGDEVICPALTFIAPANMVVLSGAKLVLVDIHPETLTLDPDLVEKKITQNTKAIIVVHQFGHAAHMDEIMALAKKYNLKVIEDNAESIGGQYRGKLLGTFGDVSTFSFFANKIITTGEGGAILTNDEDTAIKCRELRDHGMSRKKKYYHIDLGYNYRMTNMQAAIGLAQLEQLDKILNMRKRQMDYYNALLSKIPEIKVRRFKKYCKPVHWLTTITLNNEYDREDFLGFMKNKGIDCRQMVNPVYHAKHFDSKYISEDFPVSEEISRQSVHLPSSTILTKTDIKNISNIVKLYFM